MKNYIKHLILLIFLCNGCAENSTKTLLFIGSFTEGIASTGIYIYELDTKTGELSLLNSEQNLINPSFLKIAPNGKYLYSVLESQLPNNGKVAAFAIDSLNGKLQLLNTQDSGGRNPAHLSIHPNEEYLINSNYTDASFSVYNIKKDGGVAPLHQIITFKDSSIVEGRQDEAHIHSTNFSPDGKFLFAQDLGSDKIWNFNVKKESDTKFNLVSNGFVKVRPGSGPRHFTFHPNGSFAYGIAELSGSVTAYSYENGNLNFIENYLTYRSDQEIYRAADIHISPDGKFLYASNRGPNEDSIAIYSIDRKTGRLELKGHQDTHGEHPRNFAIDPSGKFLLVANQFTDNVVIFRRDIKTGILKKLPQELTVPNASSLQLRTYLR
ncbi:6-phosphogluconolactonase (cycloisomerase 2 family) [Maribacter spongiicola]|uniref:6-phosphogluconolactonase (Cycloisomerase 2 family) n=1 Tax=Maribacter spongiicola TaxID=1206753 RepID=A0A4R7KBG9_9FLAO|nr:lactonase family protein [Maribacter spongiicola]TDT47364.1 6-phosphogluconolactonase (cycloisomerase 2 family) [Maribacter spongiicola]